MRLVDWYLGLALGQKIVVGIAVFVLVLVLTYLASIVILLAAGVGPEDSPSQQGGAPVPASPTPSSSASAPSSFDNTVLKMERARWEGDKAVVEGTWQGDLSSVHCDLLEGSNAGQAIDWWDRSVAAKMSFSGRTFSQEFVRVKGDVEGAVFGGLGHGGRYPGKRDAPCRVTVRFSSRRTRTPRTTGSSSATTADRGVIPYRNRAITWASTYSPSR